MRKAQKEQAWKLVELISQAHEEIKKYLELHNHTMALDLLAQCQQGAIELGNFIEKFEGETSSVTKAIVRILEEYCEYVYNTHEEISQATSCNQSINENKIYKNLRKKLIQIENSIKNDIPVRREVVFLPYKASMWDSLESVYLAAREDPNCDAYVIPIPYYDRNKDGSMGQEHYEIDMYPKDIPVIRYDTYDFGQRRPDMIFIHNPYDDNNMVTSVHPFFYSDKMKKCTDCLVYIPYFATAGGQSDGQASLPAYYNADYIVIQSEKYSGYYDPNIPREKFLAFGSPKFDSVIRKCRNPQEIPDEWKGKMLNTDGSRKKVYFYNTSIAGMLGNTGRFLEKMEYVFSVFREHREVCLLWRPHPLLESTFESMRPQFKAKFEEIRDRYITEDFGIYDKTPYIEDTIALSDVYIGDGGTSVTSLFGVAGKPIFLFDNNITSKPGKDDWKGWMGVTCMGIGDDQERYRIFPENKLFYSPDNDHHYKYLLTLVDKAGGGYYQGVVDYGDKAYVIPGSAQDILVLKDNKIVKKIELAKETTQAGAFSGYWYVYRYAYMDKIYILPLNYPSLVVLDVKTDSVSYINGIRDFAVAMVDGQKMRAACWIWNEKMHFLNPMGTKLLTIDMNDYSNIEVRDVPFGRFIYGLSIKDVDYEELWMIPYSGTVVTRWNIETGETRDYDLYIDGLMSLDRRFGLIGNAYVLGGCAFKDDGKMIFTPNWGNKFIEFDPETGSVREWESPLPATWEDKSPYIRNWGTGGFIRDMYDFTFRFWYAPERKTYDIDLETKEISEVDISYDYNDVADNIRGFSLGSDWNMYSCNENVFNSLENLITDGIHGGRFDRETQTKAYSTINASMDGNCGEKVYTFLKGR
jgi:hypothetical protein